MQLSSPGLKSKGIAQCPHGMMPGACPACSGGGGGGAGGGKAKTAGLMSWNEAFAVWNAIQLSENRQKDYLKTSATNALSQRQEALRPAPTLPNQLPFLGTLIRNVANFLGFLGLNAAPNNAPRTEGTTRFGQVASPAQTFGEQLAGMARLVSQKLAATIADAIHIVETAFQNNLEVLKSLMAQMKWESIMDKAYRVMGRLLSPSRTHSVLETLNEKMKPLLNALARLLGKDPERVVEPE